MFKKTKIKINMESIFFINCYKEKYPQKSKILMLGLATFELKYNISQRKKVLKRKRKWMKKRNKNKKKFYSSHCYCAWLDSRLKSWKMMASVVSMTFMLEWVQLNRTNRYIISQKEMHKDKGNFLPRTVQKSVSIKNIYPMPEFWESTSVKSSGHPFLSLQISLISPTVSINSTSSAFPDLSCFHQTRSCCNY